jgi:transcriptional regulator with XRE-family HTH domain
MTYEVLEELGKNIHVLRVAKSMSQQQLAEKADLSLPFINLIENGKRKVSLETLLSLLSALDVTLSEFFLPYSQEDNELKELLVLLQKSSEKEKYIKLFTEILILAEK